MDWAIDIGRVFGIRIRLHYVFLLLLAFVFFSGVRSVGLAGGLTSLLFVCAVFAIVAVHELGHSLVAMHHGVRVADITLLPIGGVARLTELPEDPFTEFKIAIAGPMVNFAIALVTLPVLALMTAGAMLFAAPRTPLEFAVQLYAVNLIMGLFNLIPAFPLDGGRILRALLARRRDYLAATETAARIGRRIALAMGVVGLIWNPWLIVLAIFIWTAGAQEARMVRMRRAAHMPFEPFVWFEAPPRPTSFWMDEAQRVEEMHRRMAQMLRQMRREQGW